MYRHQKAVSQSKLKEYDMENNSDDLQQWLAARKKAGLAIDPETAEVCWEYGGIFDPYNTGQIPHGDYNVGRVYFAKAPESDIWVAFKDLPESTLDALCQRLWAKSGAGL
jgi:hypothetical protein